MTERDCCQPLPDGGVLGIGAAVIAARNSLSSNVALHRTSSSS
jgi:hypothetical protein